MNDNVLQKDDRTITFLA